MALSGKRRPRSLLTTRNRTIPYLVRDQYRDYEKAFWRILKETGKEVGVDMPTTVRLWSRAAKRLAIEAIRKGVLVLPHIGALRLLIEGRQTSRGTQWKSGWHFECRRTPLERLRNRLAIKASRAAILQQLPEYMLWEASVVGRLSDLPGWRSVVEPLAQEG